MNQEQLNAWKSAAQKSDGLVRIYAEDLLAIIALAERALLAAAPAPIQQEPVLWVESEPSIRDKDARYAINSLCHTVVYHMKKPDTTNPVWPLYAATPARVDTVGGDAAQCTLGVGGGSGNLFVVGDYDSIKAAQAWILRAEKSESRLAEIQRGVEVTPELLRHLQLHTELGAHACADLAGGYSLITEIIEAAFKFRQPAIDTSGLPG